MQKTATHIVPSEILDDAPTHSSAAIEAAFVFPLPPPPFPSSPFSLFRAMYFTNARLSADVLFCPRRQAARRERDCITAARSFAKLRRMPRGKRRRNFAVYGELINAVCAGRKNAVCEVHSTVSPVGLKICGLNGTFCESKYWTCVRHASSSATSPTGKKRIARAHHFYILF